MTEYIAKCKSVETDTITASVDGDTVELLAEQLGDYRMETYLRPDAARTFARGILALADEIDGGEVFKDAGTRPKVGDRLRVLEAGANGAPVHRGQIVTVHATDYDNGDGTDYIRSRVTPGDDYAYFISLAKVEPVEDAPEPARTPQVGDKVRVVKDDSNNRTGMYVGRIGTLTRHRGGFTRLPYGVSFGDGSGHHGDRENGMWYVAEVELVEDAPATDMEGSVTAQDSRLAALEHAKRLAPVGADLLAYARFLLGE